MKINYESTQKVELKVESGDVIKSMMTGYHYLIVQHEILSTYSMINLNSMELVETGNNIENVIINRLGETKYEIIKSGRLELNIKKEELK